MLEIVDKSNDLCYTMYVDCVPLLLCQAVGRQHLLTNEKKQLERYELPSDEALMRRAFDLIACEACFLSEYCDGICCMRSQKLCDFLRKWCKNGCSNDFAEQSRKRQNAKPTQIKEKSKE